MMAKCDVYLALAPCADELSVREWLYGLNDPTPFASPTEAIDDYLEYMEK